MDDETRLRFDVVDARLASLANAMAITRSDFHNTKEFLLKEATAIARELTKIEDRLARLEKREDGA